jgi:signal transduction histidine kinase
MEGPLPHEGEGRVQVASAHVAEARAAGEPGGGDQSRPEEVGRAETGPPPERDPRELTALLAITRAVTSSFGLDEVLRRSLDTFLDETSAEAAEVWLLEGETLNATIHRGADPEAFGVRSTLPIGEGLPGRAALGDVPIVVHDLPLDARFVRTAVVHAGYRSFCAIPLRYRERLVGVLTAAARPAEAMTEAWELRLLGNVGEWLALAIDHARLHLQVQDDAVIQEREWIARELHDGVGQVVGSILARMMAVRKLLADGRIAETQAELDEVEGLARGVYADLREAMLGLRTTPRREEGLLRTISTFVAGFAGATGIDANVDSASGSDGLIVSTDVEIQLVRILQEALSNVRKHAGARAVHVQLEHDGPFLQASVTDDGRGFDPAAPRTAGWPRFGLQTMRERAESVGGSLVIDGSPGRGTRVMVRVPLLLGARAS